MSIHPEGKVYKVRWREGKRQRSRTFYTRKDAEAYELERKRRKSLGAVSITSGEEDFNQFVDEWWEAHKTTLAPATQDLYAGTLERYIRPFFSGCKLHDITPQAVEQFRMALAAEGKGNATQLKALAILSAICKKAVQWQRLQLNPVTVVDKPSQARQRLIQPIPPEKVEALREALRTTEERMFVSCLAYTGARPAEVYDHLLWRDIDGDHLILHGEKTGKDRQVRLLGPLRDDLMDWKFRWDLSGDSVPLPTDGRIGQVFGWSESRYRNWARKHFKPAAEAVGLEGVTPYSLRHAFVTLLLTANVPLPIVARQLGHSIRTCSDQYTHLEYLGEHPVPAEDQIRAAREKGLEVVNG